MFSLGFLGGGRLKGLRALTWEGLLAVLCWDGHIEKIWKQAWTCAGTFRGYHRMRNAGLTWAQYSPTLSMVEERVSALDRLRAGYDG